MDQKRAQKIIKHITKLASVISTFHATYGADYALNEESPKEAWALYSKSMAQQAKIANYLDGDALYRPHSRWGHWWERNDIMPIALINEMASDAMLLVERTAYALANEASPEATHIIQEGIAGMLHPATRHRDVVRHEEG